MNSEAGAVYVVLGPVTGTHDIGAAAAAKYVGIGHGDHAGYSLDGAGDVDGDGTPDVIVGAPYVRDAEIGPYVGAAYLLYGGGL